MIEAHKLMYTERLGPTAHVRPIQVSDLKSLKRHVSSILNLGPLDP